MVMEREPTVKKMKQVGDLFAKYRKLLKPPQASVEKEFVVVVKDVAGLTISDEQVHYKVSTRTIGLTVPSLIKTEIKFKEQEILHEITNRLGEGNQPTTII